MNPIILGHYSVVAIFLYISNSFATLLLLTSLSAFSNIRCAIRLGINAIGIRKRWQQWLAYTVAHRVHSNVTAQLSAANADALQTLQDACDQTVSAQNVLLFC